MGASRMTSVAALATAGLLFVSGRATADDGSYYLFNGRDLTHVRQGRPEEVVAKEWQIWLYPKGAATSGRQYWGAISGKSVAAVRAELKNSQDFERVYERWCGCPWGEETNLNPLGPIAIVEAPLNPKLDRAIDLAGRIAALRKIVAKISEITGPGRPANPFKAVGSVFKEYVSNLKDAQGKLRRLRRMMNDIAVPSMDATFAELDQMIASGESSEPRVLHAIDAVYHQNGGLNGPWTSSSYRSADGTRITQTIQYDATGVTVTLTAAGAGGPMTRTYSFDPASIATDQIRIRAGGPTGWLVTVTAPGRKITDVAVSPDGQMTAHASTVDLAFTSEESARAAVDALTALSRSLSSRPQEE